MAGHVAFTFNGRTFKLQCGDGEEPRLRELTEIVSTKLQALLGQYGRVGDERLLLMSALLIADEMVDLRARVAALEARLQAPPAGNPKRQPAGGEKQAASSEW